MMRIFFLILAFVGLASQFVVGQNLTTKGKRFWVGFMQNVGEPQNPSQGVQLSVYISATSATSGTVSIPVQGWSQNFNVAANSTIQVSIPANLAHTFSSEIVDKTGVLIIANDSVNVFGLNAQQFSTDASVVLPENTLREEYIVMAYDEALPSQYPSEILIIAPQDNTQIQITPSVNTTGGKQANVPFTITLNRGETYQLQSTSDLTGTRVKATGQVCRAFAVFAGHRCTNIGDCPNCDHVFEQMFPINTLGKEYLAVPSRSRERDFLRILATENNTTVTASDGTTFTLNAGQFNQTPIQVINSIYVKANKPIMAAQYTRSACCDAINTEACGNNFGFRYSDPYMLLLSPVEQMIIRQATVNSFNYNQIDSSFINIATKTANKNLVSLDGANIGNSFTPIPGNPLYSTARMNVAKGNHTIRSDSGFVAFVYGFGERISYGYSADAVLNNIALQIKTADNINLSGICPGTTIKFVGESSTTVSGWKWNFGDGQNATGQNTTHIFNEPGTYYVKLYVQREGVCSEDSTIREVIIKGPTILNTNTDVVCNGQNNGSISVSASGGAAPYTYSLNNGPFGANSTYNNLAAGNYSIRVRDINGCTSTKNITLNQPEELNISLNRTNVTCYGLNNGKISATVTGGNPAYTYAWSNGKSSATIDSLDAGIYSLTVTDTKGCAKSANSTVTEPAPAIFGTNDPCLQIMADNKTVLTQKFKQGQLPPFPQGENLPEQNACGAIPVCQQIYVQNEPYIGQGTVSDFPADATCLQQGEKNSVWYTFTAQNNGSLGFLITAAQDYDFALFNITGKTCSDIATLTPVRCNYSSSLGPGNTTGLNFLNPQPGNITNGAGDPPIMPGLNVQAGQVFMLVVSNFSSEQVGYTLTFTGTATVFDNTKPTVTSVKNNADKCTANFGPTLTVTFSERVKCSSISTADFQLVNPNNVPISINSITCGPDSAVTSITLNINQITGLSGIYKLRIVGTILDLCNNTLNVPLNFDLPVNTPVSATAVEIVNPCSGTNNGSFKINATGGTPPYSYSLNNGPFQSSNSFTGLGVGSYSVRVSTADTCTTVVLVNLTAPANGINITTNQIQHVSCNGGNDGAININVSGGTAPYTFAWSNNQNTEDINNLIAGEYTVTVTDAQGCKSTFSATITQPAVLTISAITKGNESCTGSNNGFINITVTGGTTPYTYTWSNNATTQNLSNLTAGTYKVTVKDSKNCIVESSIEITSDPLPPAPTASDVTICGGNTATLTASSTATNPTYQWFNSSTSTTPLFTGNPYTTPSLTQNTTYYVRVRIGNCLSNPTTVTVSVKALPGGISITPAGPTTFCTGKDVTLNATPGYASYQWLRNNVNIPNSNTVSITATLAGSYVVQVTNTDGCIGKSDPITITLTTPPTLSLTATPVACKNSNTGAINLTVNGSGTPFSYFWSNGATTEDLSNLAAGSYSVTVSDNFGCVVNSQTVSVANSNDSCISGVINKYIAVTSIDVCTNRARVATTEGITVGSKVLIIQMKGATINQSNSPLFGTVNNLNNAGNYEFAIISAINGNVVTFQNALAKTYDNNSPLQIVTVPIYTNVGNNADLTAAAWNGTTGGVLVFEANNLNLISDIDVSGKGFRGGEVHGAGAECNNTDYFLSVASNNGGIKGEGIVELTPANAAGRGPAANGGGGGNKHNAGGAGGSNAGFGGQGGNEWDGCTSASVGGLGGVALTYSNAANKVFLGGGGGGGHQNNNKGTSGGNGGGIVILKANTITSSGRSIKADGANVTAVAGDDGAGGGGGAGAILLNVQTYNGSVSLSAKGGKGGNIDASKCHGPGGGGGGGVIWSNATLPVNVTTNVTSGTQGIVVNNAAPCFNGNYGASAGANGVRLTGLQTPQSNTTFTPPTVNITVTGVTTFCQGDSVRFTASSGFSSYAWVNENFQVVGTSGSYFAKTSGTYAVIATTAAGCKDTSDTRTVTVHPAPQIETTQTNPSCSGGGSSTGSITTTVTGGTPDYTYLWSNGQITPNLTNLSAGNYTLTITDSKGCKATKTVTIVSPGSFLIIVQKTNPTGPSTFDGQITATPNGGTAPYEYSLNDGPYQSSNTFTGLGPGNYTIRARDVNGCTTLSGVSLTAPCVAPVLVSVNTVTGTSATVIWTSLPNATQYIIKYRKKDSGQSFINVTVNAPDTFVVLSNLTPETTYEFEIQTACGSPKSEVKSIEFTTLPQCNNPVVSNSSICGADTVALTAASNQPDAQFVWYDLPTGGTPIFTGKPFKTFVSQTDTFYVAVRRSAGCESSRVPLIITVKDKPVIELNTTDVSCKTRQDGSIQTNVSGATAPYTYNWSNGATTPSVDSLATGTYSVTVTSANGCATTSPPIQIRLVNQATTLAFTILGDATALDTTCFRITPALNNQAGAVWNNNKFNLNFGFDLEYIVNLGSNDANGADGIAFVLQNSSGLSIGTTGQGLGYGGISPSIAIELDTYNNGGQADIACDHTAIHLNGNAGVPAVGPVQALPNNCNIEDGQDHLFRVVWKPDPKRLYVYIDGILRLEYTVDLLNDVFGGNNQVFWGFTGSTGGSINDQRICIKRTDVICPCDPVKPNLSISGPTQFCSGGNVNFTAQAGFVDYLWSTGATTTSINVNQTGFYHVKVTNNLECEGSSDTIFVKVHDPLVTTLDKTNVTCRGAADGTISVNVVSGGALPLTYLWSTGATTNTITNLAPGSYNVVVKDSVGCTSSVSTNITQPNTALNFSFVRQNPTSPYIADGKIYITPNGGVPPYQYSANGVDYQSTSPLNNLFAGTYQVHVRDANGCIRIRAVTLIAPCVAPITLTVSNITNNSAIVTWDSLPNAQRYFVSYRRKNTADVWVNVTVLAPTHALTLINLNPDTEYEFRIRTRCANGFSEYNFTSFFTLPASICPMPTGLTVSNTTDSTALVSWDSVNEAVNYQVVYRLVGTQVWDTVTVNALSVTLTGLLANRNYQVKVRSLCVEGQTSSFSAVEPFITKFVCQAPINLVIVADTFFATASWQAVPGASNYTISWRKKNTQQPWINTVVDTPNVSFVMPNLDPNTEYEFRIRTNCGVNGTSAFSAKDFTTKDKIICPTVTGITFSAISETEATISWTPGATATLYEIQYRKQGATEWNIFLTTDPTLTIINLIGGTTYEVRVRATCSDGLVSSFSPLQNFTTLFVCHTVTNLVIEADTFSAIARWNTVPGATTYLVSYRLKEEGALWINSTVTAPDTVQALFNLIPGKTYEFRVVTQCSSLTSADVIIQDFTTKDKPTCTKPSIIGFTNITDFSGTVSWTAINGANQYLVRYKTIPATDWLEITTPDASITLQDLEPGATYLVRVEAFCTNGLTSGLSNQSAFTTLYICNAPLNLVITPDTLFATVSWQAPYAASSYNLSWRIKGSTQPWINTEIDTPATTFTILNLTPGIEYEFHISTNCASLHSDTIHTTFTTLIEPTCPAPTVVFFSDITETEATVKWNTIIGTFNYTVEYRPIGATTWTAIATADTSITLEGLTPGISYQVRVKTDCAGFSDGTGVTHQFTTIFICIPPTNLVIVAEEFNANVSWDAVFGAVAYNLSWRIKDSGGNWINTTLDTPSVSLALTNLNPDTEYEFRISTVCDGSNSAETYITFNTLFAPACFAPSVFSFTNITETTGVVNWQATVGTDEYFLQYRKKGTDTWIDALGTPETNLNLSGLEAGTTYEIRVRSLCGSALSLPSLTHEFTTLFICYTPSAISLVTDSTKATLSWQSPNGATNYGIRWRKMPDGVWVQQNVTAPASSFVITPLTPGTLYEAQMWTLCNTLTSDTASFDFTTLINCVRPTTISFSAITQTTALVSWNNIPDALAYELEYRKSGVATWTKVPVTTNSHVLQNLTAGTTYEVRVRTTCSEDAFSSYSPVFPFTTLAACPIPTVGIITTTTTTATVNWSVVTNADRYFVGYRLANSSTWNTFSVNGPTPASTTISGLLPNTNYVVRVRARCGDITTNYSNEKTFKTAATKVGDNEIESNSLQSTLHFYPNPSQGIFTLEYETQSDANLELRVWDMRGRLVLVPSLECTPGINQWTIDLSDEGAGVYLLEAQQGELIQRTKIIVR